jgi:hypothetical protein
MPKRKKTDIVGLKLRLREALRKKIEAAAKAEERSLNNEVVARLERSFAQEDSNKQIKKSVYDAFKQAYEENLLRRSQGDKS